MELDNISHIQYHVHFRCSSYIFVGFSLEFRARDNSSFELATVLHNRDCIYRDI